MTTTTLENELTTRVNGASTPEEQLGRIVATGIKGRIVMVTPEIAQEWLTKYHATNRVLSRATVVQYARDMKSRRWHMTAEPIIFDKYGQMRNGQHRCHGIILSDTPTLIYVITGVDEEAQKYMDSGRKRTASDALALEGYALDTKNIAAVARGVLMFAGNGRPTQAEIIEYAQENVDELDNATRVAKALRTKLGGRVALYGVAYWHISRADVGAATEFFNALINGADISLGDPRLALRQKIMRDGVTARNNDASTLRDELAFVFKAWNLWRAGRPCKVLVYRKGEPYPIPS